MYCCSSSDEFGFGRVEIISSTAVAVSAGVYAHKIMQGCCRMKYTFVQYTHIYHIRRYRIITVDGDGVRKTSANTI